MTTALRLALGLPIARSEDLDWNAVYRVIASEYLVVLAWLRSGRLIRSSAPPGIAARWRRAVLANDSHGRRQLDAVHDLLDALGRVGIAPIVLKGIPLAQRLYGEPFVRCTSDIDLFVEARDRAAAERALGSRGWRRTSGGPPWHEALERSDAAGTLHLELHSSLVCDHLAHLPVPAPEASLVTVESRLVPAHTGVLLPAQLAAHLATHQLPSLLWIIDFRALWESLSDAERDAATEAAEASRLDRYLDWAIRLARHASGAAEGSSDALAALGIRSTGRRDVHSVVRHALLAHSAADALRVLAACAYPRPERGDAREYAARLVMRLRARGASLFGATRGYAAVDAPLRALRLERGEFVDLVRDVLASGSGVWVRARGGSMLPIIPRGSLVLLEPATEAPRAGQVVLALTADREPLLHRVRAVEQDNVRLRGDSALHDDPLVDSRDVIAVATHVRRNGIVRPIPEHVTDSPGSRALAVRRRLAVFVRS